MCVYICIYTYIYTYTVYDIWTLRPFGKDEVKEASVSGTVVVIALGHSDFEDGGSGVRAQLLQSRNLGKKVCIAFVHEQISLELDVRNTRCCSELLPAFSSRLGPVGEGML